MGKRQIETQLNNENKSKQMKYILTIFSIITFSFIIKAQTPIENVPTEYTLLAEATGNLDNDTIKERVIIYDTKREVDMGTEREVWIMKRKQKDWEVIEKIVGGVLPSEHGGMMGDAFESLRIERKCIVISHFGGSRDKWGYTHRFRKQNNAWGLIGCTISFGAVCESWTTFDYNLSTGKAIYKVETENCETEAIKITANKVLKNKLAKLPCLSGFYPGNNEFSVEDVIVYY